MTHDIIRLITRSELEGYVYIWLQSDYAKKINALALASNEKRYEAYKLEQQALKIMEEKILNAV